MAGFYVVTEAGERELERMRAKIDGISGPNVNNGPGGIAIGGNRFSNGRLNLPEEPILVTITSTGSNGATWKQLVPPNSNSASVVMTGGLTNEDIGPAFNTDGGTLSTIAASGVDGAHVWLHFRPDASGSVIPIYHGGGAVGEIVKLEKTSGTIGTQATASSWVYTVKSVSNVQIATGLSPSFARRNGTLGEATWGIGYWNAGTFVLAYAHEVIGSGGC